MLPFDSLAGPQPAWDHRLDLLRCIDIDEVAPWLERPDVAAALALDPARATGTAWARFQRADRQQPQWLVSRELAMATEIDYGPGYPFGPRRP